MPLPIKVSEILQQVKTLVKKESEEKRPEGLEEKVFTVIDFVPYNRVITLESRLTYMINDDLHDKLSKVMEKGRIPRIRALVDKLRIVDILEMKEIDPKQLEHDIYEVKLSPYGSLIFKKAGDENGERFFLKPLTENAQELALKFDRAGDDVDKIVVRCIIRPIDRGVLRSGIRVVKGGIYAWIDGLRELPPENIVQQREEPVEQPAVESMKEEGEEEEGAITEPALQQGKKGEEPNTGEAPQEPRLSVVADEEEEKKEPPIREPASSSGIVEQSLAKEQQPEEQSAVQEIVEEPKQEPRVGLVLKEEGLATGESDDVDSIISLLADKVIEYKKTGDQRLMEENLRLIGKLLERGLSEEEIKARIMEKVKEKLGGNVGDVGGVM